MRMPSIPSSRTARRGCGSGITRISSHYPLRGGTQVNIVAITRDTTNADPASPWGAEGNPSRISARFAKWHPAARGLIAAASAWTTWPLFDRAPPAPHGRPAASRSSAMPPIRSCRFFAQGAAQAIEDAAVLASSVTATPDIAAGLAAYSARRLPRASPRAGNLPKAGSPLSHDGASRVRTQHDHAPAGARTADSALRLAL